MVSISFMGNFFVYSLIACFGKQIIGRFKNNNLLEKFYNFDVNEDFTSAFISGSFSGVKEFDVSKGVGVYFFARSI